MTNVSSSNGKNERPKLRFPGFDEPWETESLGNLGTFVKGAPLSKADISLIGTPLILYGELYTTYSEVAYIINRKTDQTVDPVYYSRIGDVIIPTSGETAEDIATATCVMVPGVILAGDLNIFRTTKVDGRVVSYIIKNKVDRKISSLAQGKSVVHISAAELSKINISFPSETEQRKILELLKLLDDKIAKQSQLISILKKYKRGAIRRLLSPGSCPLKNVKWITAKMSELGSFIKGAPLSKANIADDGTPFILYGELYTTYNEVVTSIKRRTRAKVDETYLSCVGDVVIPTSGETPEEISTASCIMLPGVILAGDLNIFRSNKVDGRIISYILNHIVNTEISRIAQGKSVVHIQAGELGKITLSYPDEETQQKLIKFLSKIDKRIEIEENALDFFVNLKTGLLQQLFI